MYPKILQNEFGWFCYRKTKHLINSGFDCEILEYLQNEGKWNLTSCYFLYKEDIENILKRTRQYE